MPQCRIGLAAVLAGDNGYEVHSMWRQRRFTETLLSNLPGMAYRCLNDKSWTMTYVSAGCEALTGHNAEFITGSNSGWVEMIHRNDRDATRTAVTAALAAGKRFDLQYRIVDKDGREKWVREQGCGIFHADGSLEAIEGYIDDITVLMSTVQALESSEAWYEEKIRPELRRQREQLAHADRLNTLGEMATGIAHEINKPLTAISLFAQAGRRLLEAGDYSKLQDVLDKLSKHSRRAGAIVERMQNMARRQESVRRIADLNVLVKDVVELAEIDARVNDICIEISLASRLPKVLVDTVQIQQVILNVLRNGMDAMSSRGPHNDSTIRIMTGKNIAGFLQIDIVDSGCGISDEVAENIFEPFSTSKSTGLGMGLPISKAIVEAHGGQLMFSNNDQAGATFSITLPVAANVLSH